jgi:hypothetical protein
MKKSQKNFLILTIILSVILAVIATTLIVSDINFKDIPLWAIIMVLVSVLISPFIVLLSQRMTQLTIEKPLQKQKKILLITFCTFIILSAITLIITYYINYDFFWILLLSPIAVLPFLLIRLIRLSKEIAKNSEI